MNPSYVVIINNLDAIAHSVTFLFWSMMINHVLSSDKLQLLGNTQWAHLKMQNFRYN